MSFNDSDDLIEPLLPGDQQQQQYVSFQQEQQNGFFDPRSSTLSPNYFGNENEQSSYSPLPDLRGITNNILEMPKPPIFQIENVFFPDVIHKKQQRKKGRQTNVTLSKQALQIDPLVLHLKFEDERFLQLVERIDVEVHNQFKNISSKVQCTFRLFQTPCTIRLELDLNTASDYNVFELPRSTNKDKKTFYCTVEVKYSIIEATSKKNTGNFVIMGSERKLTSDGASADYESQPKRIKANSVSSNDSGVSPSPENSYSADHERTLDEYSRIVTKSIQTRTLKVGNTMFTGETIQTPRHDIGYHFELEDEEEVYEEGQVVVLVPVETEETNEDIDDQKMPTTKQRLVVAKMSQKSSDQAVLKGVITESPYIEAYCPKRGSDKRTAIICMMGIVPVQVVGSVRPNEFLYASPDHPGFAVSGFHLKLNEKKDAALVGVAFSSHVTKNESSVGLVDAGVSLLESASRYLVEEKLRSMEQGLDEKITTYNKTSIRWRRVFCIALSTLVILLALLGIFLWQLYTPGSVFRKWNCKRGHKTPFSTGNFYFIPYGRPYYGVIETYGIEFDFDVLVKKVKHTSYKRINKIVDGIHVGKPHYYIGFNRCAYGDDTEYVTPSGERILRGPDMFVFDEKCLHVFYYHDKYKTWLPYISVNGTKDPTKIYCNPPYKHRKKNLFLEEGYLDI